MKYQIRLRSDDILVWHDPTIYKQTLTFVTVGVCGESESMTGSHKLSVCRPPLAIISSPLL